MTFSIIVERDNGQFSASLVGAPSVRAIGPSRPEALQLLQQELARRIEQGELATLEVPATDGIAGLAGRFADDPTLQQICDEAYAERDRERDRNMGDLSYQ